MSNSALSPRHPLVAIVGATGTAQRFHGEIVNCDALQMYEGLHIATNKVSADERNLIRHHLLDCISLDEEPWTVSKFRKQATDSIEEIRSRGRLPILVGGTHYYTQSILFKDTVLDDDCPQMPAEEQERRWPILSSSSEEMYKELLKVDPVMAKRWHPRDKRKIRRSLEIWFITGRKPSETYEMQKQGIRAKTTNEDCIEDVQQAEHDDNSQHMAARAKCSLRYDSLIFWTHASPSALRSRLNSRIDNMLKQGLLSEVQSMYQSLRSQESAGIVVDQSRGIWVAIGYKEFMPYLLAQQEGGVSPKELGKLKHAAVEEMQIHTRQYAKNQIRWIRTQLLSALSHEGSEKRIFLLDGSNVSNWATDVDAVACNVTAAFLTGGDLPDPKMLCPAAAEMLSPAAKQERKLRHCDACEKNTMTDDAWRDHLKSTKHRRTVRATVPVRTSVQD